MPSACTSPKPVHAVMVLLTVVFLWFAMKRDPLPAREAFQLARGKDHKAYIPGHLQHKPEPKTPGLQNIQYLRGRNRKNRKRVSRTFVQQWVREQLESCAQITDCRNVFFTMSGKGKSLQYEARRYDKTAEFVKSNSNKHTLFEMDSRINAGPVDPPYEPTSENDKIEKPSSNRAIAYDPEGKYWWIGELENHTLGSRSGAPTARMFTLVTDTLNNKSLSQRERNEALKYAVLLLLSISVITDPKMVDNATWTRRTFFRGFVKSLMDRFEEHGLAYPIADLIMAMREYASPYPNIVAMDDEAFDRVPSTSALFPAALHFAALRLGKTVNNPSLDALTDALNLAGVDTARVLFGAGDPGVEVYSFAEYQQMMDKNYTGRMSLSEALKNAMAFVYQSSDARPHQEIIVSNEATDASVQAFNGNVQQVFPYTNNGPQDAVSHIRGFFK